MKQFFNILAGASGGVITTPIVRDIWDRAPGVYIYETGLANGDANYNDWAFVRTPADYDYTRAEPYPIVICNHGNGWVMDGSAAKANYTSKTQFGVDTGYTSTGLPYYKQYSNETIERLLEAGYVVCGTQNYADALYGNDNCRNALVDFFTHMKYRWNVELKCFMIGASNGAMTSLNGALLLGVSKINAMVLQYPLTLLFRHYKGYANHRGQINTAYGLTGTESDSQLITAFEDHDVEYANTVETGGLRYLTTPLPPMKLWYSNGDTVVDADNNAIPLIALIQRSNGQVESVVATGDHGDPSHFNPVATLQFFNTYL